MKQKIYNLHDLKDSRLLYEKNPPIFGYMIIILVLLLIITTIVWAATTIKPTVVRGMGTVDSANRNYVMIPYSGTIEKININEGDVVSKGDVLLVIKSFEKESQKEQHDLQADVYETLISEYEYQIYQYEKLKKSINDEKNYFGKNAKDSLYYNKYESYISNKTNEKISAEELKDLGYTDKQIEDALKNNDTLLSNIKFTALEDADKNILSLNTEIESMQAETNASKKVKTKQQVIAPISGKVHLLGEYKSGMVVQAGMTIASISTENDKHEITAMISPADRAKIHENDNVEMEVQGLPQSIYGTLKGKVLKIDSNISQNEEDSSQLYFKITIEPEETFLSNKEGDIALLNNGLTVEARITYEEMTYLQYLLEGLGFKSK